MKFVNPRAIGPTGSVRRGLIPRERLIERFRLAMEWFALDARADDLPEILENLHFVERSLFGASPTAIDLPA